eukprot:SAG11_NODE_5308_length_1600_cov_1.511659_1_plen_37_part_10
MQTNKLRDKGKNQVRNDKLLQKVGVGGRQAFGGRIVI